MLETAEIRQLLTKCFNDEEIEFFCFDYYRDVYDQFASGLTKGRKIHLLIQYCDSRRDLSTLCKFIYRERPEILEREISEPVTIDEFLREAGFKDNPFATTNAEEETNYLSSFFVHVPWFQKLIGNPQHPESLILFAPRGHGKTSHRLEVGRLASQKCCEHRALVVNFDDINLLQSEENPCTIRTYLSYIRRKTLQTLREQIDQNPEYLESLQKDEEALARFSALCQLYAPLRQLKLDLPEADVTRFKQAYEQTNLSLREWLRDELCPLAQSAGFASIYILVDGVDESHETSDNPEAMFQALSSLLNAPGVLQGNGFAFKLFLPEVLEETLRKRQGGRFDRIAFYHLQWTEQQLREALSLRLTSYSLSGTTDSSGRVKSFQDLCDPDDVTFNVDARLVEAAYPSPRKIIELARKIVELHCTSTSDVCALIKAETINKVLASKGAT